jgi:hypothetical protein
VNIQAKSLSFYNKFINNKDSILPRNESILSTNYFSTDVNDIFQSVLNDFEDNISDLNEIEEVLKLARRQYEENGMNNNILSDTEDGYRSGGSSISDKTYMMNNLERKSKKYFPSVLIDLIDIENKH